ncbi:hypothetical protein PV392_25055 [Streptomyces sp. ME03-5709C]|nr:hypothetical protein [Streptomyces sp. ME03-5709C]
MNLLNVPNKNSDHAEVTKRLAKIREACDLVLPVTAVIETGNHVAQIKDGGTRGRCAERFAGVIRMSISGQAPWVLNTVAWDAEFLQSLLDGAGTGSNLVDLARAKLGCGDLSILTEVERYGARTSRVRISVWTLDEQLSSYCDSPPS